MDLKNLKSKDKVKYILKLQRKGLGAQDIADKMGYSKLKKLNQFMDKQGYINQDNNYVLKSDVIYTPDDLHHNSSNLESTSKELEDNYISSIGQQDKLISLLSNHLEIFEMLDWFKQMKAKHPTLDILNDISINYNKSNIIKTTIRVDENIWNGFSDICKNKYNHLSKVDILSQILKDFNDKNKKP